MSASCAFSASVSNLELMDTNWAVISSLMPAVVAMVRGVVGRLRAVGIGRVLRALLRAAVRAVGRVRGAVLGLLALLLAGFLGLPALTLVGFVRFNFSKAFLRSSFVVISTSVAYYL
jgi:hypothetical protein